MQIQTSLPSRLLPVLALLALTSCRDDEHIDQLQKEVRSLSDQFNQSQGELNRLKTQLNSIGKERDVLKEERARLDADLEAARKTLDKLQKDFATYRSQYRISMMKRAPGLGLGDFEVDGKTYRKVKAREATEEQLSVMHDSGTQKFAWSVLPDPIRKLFGIEKPGEFVMINYSTTSEKSAPLSREEQAKRHEGEVLEGQKQISAVQLELKNLAAEERANRKAIADARNKGLDTVDLQRKANAYSVKRAQLEHVERQLKQKLGELLRQDPRKKKL